jgi:Methylamine utilisation protein MauE
VNAAVIASVVLGAVMLLAGGSKLASRTWPTQAADLAVPRLVAGIVPWLELALGAGLVVQLSGRLFGIATALLITVFTAKLIVLLRRGQRPPCACFGGRVPRPISWLSVARNAALIGWSVGVAVLS